MDDVDADQSDSGLEENSNHNRCISAQLEGNGQVSAENESNAREDFPEFFDHNTLDELDNNHIQQH